MHASATRRVELLPAILELAHDGRLLRIVRDARRRRPGQNKMRSARRVDVLHESVQDTNRILQSIPARNLKHDGLAVGKPCLLEDLGAPPHLSGAPIRAHECG